MIFYILGKMMGVEGIVLLIPAFVSLLYQEKSGFSFLIVSAVLILIYFVLGRKEPKSKRIYSKEGFAIVGLAWLLWSAFGALPFVISGSIPHYIDAFFETVSGFTTTGSTILTEIEILPKGIAFWRSFTHWIGGMGVLVFVMMITSLDDDNAMPLMRAEVPGPEADKLVPKARRTAKILYGMYFALTAVETVFLMAGGMSFFDALLHAFSTAGTGGFSNKNASVGFFDSAYIDGVITIFMILFGINFSAYFLLLSKKLRQAIHMEEVRWYLIIIFASIVFISFNARAMFSTLEETIRHVSFQVASVITTTGFATTDFDLWPEFSRTILVILMFIGACAGSTGGGIKVSRFILLIKTMKKELHTYLHPRSVRKIQLDGKVVEHNVLRSTNVYMIAYILIFVASVLLISLDNFDLTTNFTAVSATLNNIGPGLELVGPTQNFSLFSNGSKLILIFDMLAGRLELFPLLLLFVRDSWRRF